MVFGIVLMCLHGQVAPGQEECKIFYKTVYETEEACLANVDNDAKEMEYAYPMAKAEDKVCLTVKRKGNL